MGNWLLLEPWMSPSLYDKLPLTDEYTFSQQLGSEAERVLRRHRETWITENDFKWLAERGINAVRIPFGYWILESDGPFVKSPEVLDHAIDLCERYKIQAVLDLHGLPGFQSGEGHSGRRRHFRWPADEGHLRHSLDVIEALAGRYAGRKGVSALSLVNEPSERLSRDVLVSFYAAAAERVRRHMPPEEVAVVISAYPENRMSEFHGCLPEVPNVWTDVHLYQSFCDWPNEDPFSYIRAAAERHDRLRHWLSQGEVIVGEWSLSWPSRLVGPKSELSSLAHEGLMRAYADVQLASFEATRGWFFWSYKVEDRPEWSFRDAVERGWMPDCYS